jgi:microcystin-dependent protein
MTVLNPTLANFTVTIASPGLVTQTAHGLATGDSIYITTTGALPTGLAINTRYWVIKNDANSYWLATTQANALLGTKINTSGSQSGTHTATGSAYGIGDGSTTFTLPSIKGNVMVGKDQSQTEFAGLGQTGGAKTHTLTTAEMPSHTHAAPVDNSGTGGTARALANTNGAGTAVNTASAGSDGAHNNLQPYVTLNYIIKT